MNKVSLALINQQPIILDGLQAVFLADDRFAVVAKSRSITDASAIAVQYNPDILILDLDGAGEAIKAISEIGKGRTTKVIVFAPVISVDAAVQALDAGAAAYVSTNCMADELLAAIETVSRGDTFISPSIAAKVIAALRAAAMRKATIRTKRLSVREDQIVGLLLRGMTNKEIAAQLGLSEKTVKHYMGLLMQKLEARNRLELALAWRNIDPAASMPDAKSFN